MRCRRREVDRGSGRGDRRKATTGDLRRVKGAGGHGREREGVRGDGAGNACGACRDAVRAAVGLGGVLNSGRALGRSRLVSAGAGDLFGCGVVRNRRLRGHGCGGVV